MPLSPAEATGLLTQVLYLCARTSGSAGTKALLARLSQEEDGAQAGRERREPAPPAAMAQRVTFPPPAYRGRWADLEDEDEDC